MNVAFGFEDVAGGMVTDTMTGSSGDLTDATTGYGRYGAGLSFAGTVDSRMAIAHTESVMPTGGMTVSVWARPGGDNGGYVALKEGSYGFPKFVNGAVEGMIVLKSSTAAVNTVTVSAPEKCRVDVWQMYTLTYDGSMVRMYVNGQEAASAPASGSIARSMTPLIVGNSAGTYAANFAGTVDELNIYGYALTGDEVLARFLTVPNYPPNQPETPRPSNDDQINGNRSTLYGFTFQAHDFDGDDLRYTIDWVDGKQSTTTFVADNLIVISSHAWDAVGVYDIRVQVEDVKGSTSAWSASQRMSIYNAISAAINPGSLLNGYSAGVSQSTMAVSANTIGEPVASTSVSGAAQCAWGYQGDIAPNNTIWCTGQPAYVTNPHGVESAPPAKQSVSEIAGLTDINAIRQAIAAYSGTLARDANGNVILGNGRWIKYDYDNRPILVVNADGSGERYAYDHDGQRVKKQAFTTAQVVTSTTVYIGTIFEKTTTAGSVETQKYLYAGSQRIGIRKGTGEVSYIHGDHLGSTSLMTDESGKVVRTTQYQPYGATYTTTGTRDTTWKFTGQKEDANTGLYYCNARYYDPQLGVFITPDTFVQDLYDPQTLNRYTYCRNNPIIYTDPSGHIFGIDDLLFIAIVASAGAVKEGTHNFSGTWDWGAAGQGALTWGAAAAGVCGLNALTGFDSWAMENFDVGLRVGLEGQYINIPLTHGVGLAGSGAAVGAGAKALQGMLPSSLSLPSNQPTGPTMPQLGPTDGPIRQPGVDYSVAEGFARGNALLGTPYNSLKCNQFVAAFYGTDPIYTTRNFGSNPAYQMTTDVARGDVIIWRGYNAGAFAEGHAAIYTGESGDRALLHSNNYIRQVSYTSNYVDSYFSNEKHFDAYDKNYYRYIK